MSRLVTDHLPLLAGAPNGVKKLRELILELAVRGKLVAQDSTEESAATQINRITSKKDRLIAQKIIKKPKPVDSVSENEHLFDTPNGWSWCRLENISPMSLVDGDWIESKDQDPSGGIRLIQLADIGVGEFKDKSDRQINSETFKKLSCTELQAGDILIARLPNPIGRACIFPGLTQKCITVVDVAILRPDGLLCSEYIVHAINCSTFRTQVESYGKGATRFRIATGHLKTLLIPIPPLAEQYRIVAKVDELMALCDRLETRQSDAQAAHARLVDELLGSLLQARDAEDFAECWGRVKGSFDVIFSSEESFDALRKAILHVAAEGRLVTTTSPAQFIPIEKLLVGDTLNGCSRKPFDEPIGTPILRISAATGSDDFFVDEIDHRWVELSETEKGKFNLQPNDLLACRFNGNLHYVGSFALYRGSKKVDPIFPDKLIRFRINPEIARPHYIRYVINATPARKQIESFCATTVGNIGISATNLKTVQVRVPEIEEQERIIAKLDEILALCDRLKARIRQARQVQERLVGTLVERAVS